MFGLATSENEGETLFPPAKQEAEEPAPKGAKPKAKRDAPTQSQSSAKPAVDPLEARRAKCQQSLTGFFNAGDKQVVGLWRHHMKLRFNGALKVEEKHLKCEHLTTAEMLDECEAWIATYQVRKSMTLAPISYDPDHDVKTAARALARALNRMADLGQTGQLYGQYKGALTLLLDKSCDAEPVLPALPQRVRH